MIPARSTCRGRRCSAGSASSAPWRSICANQAMPVSSVTTSRLFRQRTSRISERRRSMVNSHPVALAGALCGMALWLAFAAPQAQADSIPIFSAADYGWFPVGDDFLPPASGPGPVVSDPAHPYYSNQSGRQPTDRVADLTNPILNSWALERLRQSNKETLAGRVPFSPRETCRPAGVPGFAVFSRLRPVYFLQRPGEVTIIND